MLETLEKGSPNFMQEKKFVLLDECDFFSSSYCFSLEAQLLAKFWPILVMSLVELDGIIMVEKEAGDLRKKISITYASEK